MKPGTVASKYGEDMSKGQWGVLWLGPVALAIVLYLMQAEVGGLSRAAPPGVALIPAVPALAFSFSVYVTSTRLPGVQWWYGFSVLATWWVSGLVALAVFENYSPSSAVRLWLAVPAVTAGAVILSYLLRSRNVAAVPPRSRCRVLWQGSSQVNIYSSVLVPVALFYTFAGLSFDSALFPAFGVPLLAMILFFGRYRVTIFEDQVQVKNWLGFVMLRVPISSVRKVGVTDGHFGHDFRSRMMVLGWLFHGDRMVLQTDIWRRDTIGMYLETGESIEIRVHAPFEAMRTVRDLVQAQAPVAEPSCSDRPPTTPGQGRNTANS